MFLALWLLGLFLMLKMTILMEMRDKTLVKETVIRPLNDSLERTTLSKTPQQGVTRETV